MLYKRHKLSYAVLQIVSGYSACTRKLWLHFIIPPAALGVFTVRRYVGKVCAVAYNRRVVLFRERADV